MFIKQNENNIVNNFGLLKSYENIYIMDSSLLPTNTGQHPQLTIMSRKEHPKYAIS